MREYSIPGLDYPEHLGSYRLVRELGRGATGTVFLAYQEMLERDLAIKVLSPTLTNDEAFVERFRREAKVAARLRHAHIAQVHDAGVQDGLYYIVMEYLGSRNLHQLLSGGRLTQAQSLTFLDHLLRALEYSHSQGIVHRDVKPANILISDTDEATLTDFSIAYIKTGTRLTVTGTLLGTPEYMAPEQFEGKGIDGRADLYATAVILYECLTGTRPFRGESMPEIMKAHFYHTPPLPDDLPPALQNVIRRGLEKNPADRFQSAEEMRLALVNSGGGPPEATLEQFLAGVTSGRISLDEANLAREKVKQAIDRGYKRPLTVMMVDLAGSSQLKQPGETLLADRAFRDYRTSINGVLKDYGCTSFDWSGDGAICIFEQPLPAVQAALVIQGLVGEVAARHPQLPARLLTRVGIHTGDVYLDPRRGLGEFASRTVDQAGHLEKDCPPGEVHVSQPVMEATGVIAYVPVGINRDGLMVYRTGDEYTASEPVESPSTVVVEASVETGVELIITNPRGTRRAAVNRARFRVGPDAEYDLFLPVEFELHAQDGGVVLECPEGLLVNGRPAFRRVLRPADELEVGDGRIALHGLPPTQGMLLGDTLIPLADEECSLEEATVYRERGQYWLRAETQAKVNGEALKHGQSRTLSAYDLIQVGRHRYRFFDHLPEVGALACLDVDVRPPHAAETVSLVMQAAVESLHHPLPFLGAGLTAWYPSVLEALAACRKLSGRLQRIMPAPLDFCLAVWAGEMAVGPRTLRAVAEPLARAEELARAGRVLGAQVVLNHAAYRLAAMPCSPLGALDSYVLEFSRVA